LRLCSGAVAVPERYPQWAIPEAVPARERLAAAAGMPGHRQRRMGMAAGEHSPRPQAVPSRSATRRRHQVKRGRRWMHMCLRTRRRLAAGRAGHPAKPTRRTPFEPAHCQCPGTGRPVRIVMTCRPVPASRARGFPASPVVLDSGPRAEQRAEPKAVASQVRSWPAVSPRRHWPAETGLAAWERFRFEPMMARRRGLVCMFPAG
jgi:hypothetical protein